MKREGRVLRNMLYAFAAQGVSLMLSILSALYIPQVITDKNVIGFWYYFTMLTGFTALFHFGINDGVYLKLGGTEYEDMDKKLLGAQFRFSAIYQTAIGIVFIVLSMLFCSSADKTYIFIMTTIYMLVYNLTTYLGSIFQAANETRLFSLSVMIDKIVFLVSIVALFAFHESDYKPYVFYHIVAKVVALIFCIIVGREVVFSKRSRIDVALRESLDSIKIGIKLTVATIAGNFILGIGRLMIENKWDEAVFADVAFSFTLTNFFLLFISQISMVLFPALRQVDESKQKTLYSSVKKGLGVFLPIIYILFIPAKLILGWWLPRYQISFTYMAILLPLCILDGKMNLVNATLFKVQRKETFLLVVNLIALATSTILCAIGAYTLESVNLVTLFMVIAIAVRYYISQVYLEKMLGDNDDKRGDIVYIISEFILMIICSYACFKFNALIALLICIVVYGLYLAINYKNVLFMADKIKTVVKEKIKK